MTISHDNISLALTFVGYEKLASPLLINIFDNFPGDLPAFVHAHQSVYVNVRRRLFI